MRYGGGRGGKGRDKARREGKKPEWERKIKGIVNGLPCVTVFVFKHTDMEGWCFC